MKKEKGKVERRKFIGRENVVRDGRFSALNASFAESKTDGAVRKRS